MKPPAGKSTFVGVLSTHAVCNLQLLLPCTARQQLGLLRTKEYNAQYVALLRVHMCLVTSRDCWQGTILLEGPFGGCPYGS